VAVAVIHTDGINLFFVTFDAVRGTNIISENPSFCLTLFGESESHAARDKRASNQEHQLTVTAALGLLLTLLGELQLYF